MAWEPETIANGSGDSPALHYYYYILCLCLQAYVILHMHAFALHTTISKEADINVSPKIKTLSIKKVHATLNSQILMLNELWRGQRKCYQGTSRVTRPPSKMYSLSVVASFYTPQWSSLLVLTHINLRCSDTNVQERRRKQRKTCAALLTWSSMFRPLSKHEGHTHADKDTDANTHTYLCVHTTFSTKPCTNKQKT